MPAGPKRVLNIVGARPNFVKAAPVHRALGELPGVEALLVHTGQHYDRQMSEIFFEQLGFPEPDYNLGAGSGTHAEQTAAIMTRFEALVAELEPDLTLVYGDVNSTLACSLVCAKAGVRVGHVEAGLRSFDRSMPEEINRMVTDRLADYHYTPSADGDENLLREGARPEQIQRVGNCMIDTLVRLSEQSVQPANLSTDTPYGLLTLHRPGNVDDPTQLERVLDMLLALSADLPLIFPLHPRTRARLGDSVRRLETAPAIQLCDPLGYLEFLWLLQHARLVITDSGGIQEETTYLRKPCLTMRENTERPITCSLGTNQLVGSDPAACLAAARKVLTGETPQGEIPPLWDGKAGERVAEHVQRILS